MKKKTKKGKKTSNDKLSNIFKDQLQLFNIKDDKNIEVYYEYTTLYFTLPNWMIEKKIKLDQVFKNTLLDIINSYFIDNKVRLRMLLQNIEKYKKDTYTKIVYTYIIRPDVNKQARIGFTIDIIIENGQYPNYPHSFSITLILKELIDYKTGRKYSVNRQNYDAIVKDICNNNHNKCKQLFDRIKMYTVIIMDTIATMLGIEEYIIYN